MALQGEKEGLNLTQAIQATEDKIIVGVGLLPMLLILISAAPALPQTIHAELFIIGILGVFIELGLATFFIFRGKKKG